MLLGPMIEGMPFQMWDVITTGMTPDIETKNMDIPERSAARTDSTSSEGVHVSDVIHRFPLVLGEAI